MKPEADKFTQNRVKQNNYSILESRIPGFYELSFSERQRITALFAKINLEELKHKSEKNLEPQLLDTFIENSIGNFSLPLGIATNFLINNKEYIVPMAVEESSVVAAASHGAKLIRHGGGFKTSSTEPIMTAQIQLQFSPSSKENIEKKLAQFKNQIIAYANEGFDRLIERGGGARDISWYEIPEINSIIFHLHVHTADAMGANIVNSMAEKISPILAEIFSGVIGLRILTNLCDQRMATAECWIPASAFDTPSQEGSKVIELIENAFLFAHYDPYRATTHNKGVMNGIDSVVIATGNDWRAVEAGAHAYAAKTGQYRPLTFWKSQDHYQTLYGKISIPISVGTVGGVTKLHPTADLCLKILGRPDARTLAEIIVSVGLAQNLAALRALSSEGIQHGHMGLHAKNLELMKKSKNAPTIKLEN